MGAVRSGQRVRPHSPKRDQELRVAGKHLPSVYEQPVSGNRSGPHNRRGRACRRGWGRGGGSRGRHRNGRGHGRPVHRVRRRGHRIGGTGGLRARSGRGGGGRRRPVRQRSWSFCRRGYRHRERAVDVIVPGGRAGPRRTRWPGHPGGLPGLPPVLVPWNGGRKGEIGCLVKDDLCPDPRQVHGSAGRPPPGTVVIQSEDRQRIRVSAGPRQVFLRQEDLQRCGQRVRVPGRAAWRRADQHAEYPQRRGVALRQCWPMIRGTLVNSQPDSCFFGGIRQGNDNHSAGVVVLPCTYGYGLSAVRGCGHRRRGGSVQRDRLAAGQHGQGYRHGRCCAANRENRQKSLEAPTISGVESHRVGAELSMPG